MKDPANKEGFVKLKMPEYYIAKHSDEDLKAAVLAERDRCIDIIEHYQIPVGGSSASEIACDMTYMALRDIRDEIKGERNERR